MLSENPFHCVKPPRSEIVLICCHMSNRVPRDKQLPIKVSWAATFISCSVESFLVLLKHRLQVACFANSGFLYWTDWGTSPKIERATLAGNGRRAIVTLYLHWPNGLTIDFDDDKLYWVDAERWDITKVFSVNHYTFKRTVYLVQKVMGCRTCFVKYCVHMLIWYAVKYRIVLINDEQTSLTLKCKCYFYINCNFFCW